MEYIRNNLLRGIGNSRSDSNGPSEYNPAEKTIVIQPGQVEETAHAVSLPSFISLEELRFWAYVPDPHEYNSNPKTHSNGVSRDLPQNNSHHRKIQDSYLDIVVFEAPLHCSSAHIYDNGNNHSNSNSKTPCDLPSYGIGSILNEHTEDEIPRSHLSLCNETTGRLIVDHNTFEGYHTVLHIPPSGYLMKDRITDPIAHKIPSFPSVEYQYEILIANCDTHVYGTGRNIELSGQVLFQLDDAISAAAVQLPNYYPSTSMSNSNDSGDTPWRYHIGTRHQQNEYGSSIVLDIPSQIKLFGLGFLVCFLFSFASCRIHRGTRSDYFTTRLNERQRRRRQQQQEEEEGEQQ